MPVPTSAFDDEVRALYHAPLSEFTAARQALAKRLKQAGEARHAEVRELAKPPLSAWAVNQLFAQEPRAMASFVGAGERARAAQRKAAGGGDAGPLREAIATIRGETARLAARGAELLAAAERAPGEAILERLRTNLEAMALDPAHGAVAARGWLDADLPPPGFEVLAAMQVAAAGAPPSRRAAAPAAPAVSRPRTATVHPLDDAARSTTAARKAREERERRERERRERSERLRAALSRAEADLAEQCRTAERAQQAAERAAQEAADAARRAAEVARHVAAAEEAVARARQAVEDAEADQHS
jgi:hypothetical protein